LETVYEGVMRAYPARRQNSCRIINLRLGYIVAHFCNSGHSGNVTPCRGAGRICQYRLAPTMAAGVTDRLGESGDRVALVEAALYPTEPSSAGAVARALTEPNASLANSENRL
jgi:hypothetical protein